MITQTSQQLEANWASVSPTPQLLGNEERMVAGKLIIGTIEPIILYNRAKLPVFLIGALASIIYFWFRVMDGTFPFADMRNWAFVLPYTFLAGGIGGGIAYLFFRAFGRSRIREKERELLMHAHRNARLLAHIRDTHSEDTRHNKRVRTIIQKAFDQYNET